MTRTALLLVVLLSGCVHRAPAPDPCCCVFDDHDRSETTYCDPADCPVHHGEVD
jgi:hypothetical protein